MKDSLVAASAEFQGEIFFGFDELAVYEGIDTGEHLVSVFGVDFSAGDEVYIRCSTRHFSPGSFL